MIHSLPQLRPVPSYPVYPPYHKGDYLEDYFYKMFIQNNPHVNREFIAISWTTLYCENNTEHIQPFLNSLDPDKKYFTVLQHDDAPKQSLPKDTICFSAGGNVFTKNTIPIPLVCSKLINNSTNTTKKYLATFVGSNTHPIRQKMEKVFQNKSDCPIHIKNWSPCVEKNEFELYLECALQSKYLLCPRGYGLNSFRLYEAFQLNCVPVIITDNFYLPWTDELDWSKFSILVSENDINNLYDKLHSISEEEYINLLNFGKKIYEDFFTLHGIYLNIIKRLK